jgi:hypothetical protein
MPDFPQAGYPTALDRSSIDAGPGLCRLLMSQAIDQFSGAHVIQQLRL